MIRITAVLLLLLGAVTQAPGQDITQLRKDKLAVAKQGFEAETELYKAGKTLSENVMVWSARVLEATMELDPKADSVHLLQAHLQEIRDLEKIAEAKFKAGQAPVTHLLNVKYHRIDIEILLEKTKAKKKN